MSDAPTTTIAPESTPGSPPASPAGGASNTPPAAAEAAATGPASGTATRPASAGDRPEWLPEGMADGQALAKSYAELRTAFSAKTDKLKADVLADIRKGAPPEPTGYAFTIDPKTLPDYVELTPPGDDDPMLSSARSVMHELGATPDQWNKLTAAFVAWQVAQIPNPTAETARLGEGGQARLATVSAWLARQLPEGEFKALASSMRTAESILAIERLMRRTTGTGVTGTPGGAAAGPITPAELSTIMSDPLYYDEAKGASLRARASEAIAAGVRPHGMPAAAGR